MRHQSSRSIRVNKQELIDKIKANKAQHIKDYQEALDAFKLEADKQLVKAKETLDSGPDNYAKIVLKLVVPVNKADEYDKLVTMFEWDVNDEVELSQSEFNEYVLDESTFAVNARLMNSTYKG